MSPPMQHASDLKRSAESSDMGRLTTTGRWRHSCVCVFWGGGKRRCEHASIDWLAADVRILITAVSSCDEILEDRRHGGKGDGTHGRLVGATRGVVRGRGGPRL